MLGGHETFPTYSIKPLRFQYWNQQCFFLKIQDNYNWEKYQYILGKKSFSLKKRINGDSNQHWQLNMKKLKTIFFSRKMIANVLSQIWNFL